MIIAAYPSEPYAHMVPFDQLFRDIKRANLFVKNIELPGIDTKKEFKAPGRTWKQTVDLASLAKMSRLEGFSDKVVVEPGEAAGRTLPGEILLYVG